MILAYLDKKHQYFMDNIELKPETEDPRKIVVNLASMINAGKPTLAYICLHNPNKMRSMFKSVIEDQAEPKKIRVRVQFRK